MSNNDPRLHFGLGEHKVIDLIEIQWPSGLKERLTGVKYNQILVVKEGSGVSPYLSRPFHAKPAGAR